jgi:hypothetical protein
MVSVWRADTKDTLPDDTINVFCSSASCEVQAHMIMLCCSIEQGGTTGGASFALPKKDEGALLQLPCPRP